MKIRKIHIWGFQQFKHTVLDFTHPETGEPLEKICFIGRNGTGKSTLLRIIEGILRSMLAGNLQGSCAISAEVQQSGKLVHLFYGKYWNVAVRAHQPFSFPLRENVNPLRLQAFEHYLDSINTTQNWQNIFQSFGDIISQNNDENNRVWEATSLKDDANDLLVYSPAESPQNTVLASGHIPSVTLNEALALTKHFPYHHLVSDQNVQEFWRLLIYLIKRRESEREEFENRPENLDKTKKQLIEEFEKQNPKIEEKLAELWNEILGRAGLELDIENLKKPVQLTDNLQAYIRHKASKQRIEYSQLSTGIRNFIFRIGHIYSLYFNREIRRGFLLVDEPENSLFPDFLFNLLELYQQIVVDKNGENNTQFFVATHSPIVAAQFQPYERIILEWDENGHVTAHKGHAPVGDDPNDVLEQDFGLENLMGKEGQKMWQHYLDLRKKLRRTDSPAEKEQLLSEITKIGNDYNFEE